MSHQRSALCFRSKYCARRKICSDPRISAAFGQDLEDAVAAGDYRVVFPVGLHSSVEASLRKESLEKHTRVPLPGYRTMRIACRKDLSLQLARRIGVPVPNTIHAESVEEALAAARSLEFPVVVKSVFGSGGRGVRIARSVPDVLRSWGELVHGSGPVLVQEYVVGTGFGYFALTDRGRPLAEFAHRRIHEYPGSGASTMAESLQSPEILRLGRMIMSRLGWTGLAMVEFRGAEPGRGLKLLDVNPKLWGSMALALASGVDFPYLAYRVLVGLEVKRPRPAVGVVYRWTGPDLEYARSSEKVLEYVRGWADPGIRHDVDLDDLAPTWLTFRSMVRRGIARVSRRLSPI